MVFFLSFVNGVIIRLRGCYRHRPPFAGFSTRQQVPRCPLTCTRVALVLVPHTPWTNSVAFYSARLKHHPLFHIRTSKACETLLYPAVSHIVRLVRLPGEYHNTSPP